MTSEVDPPVPSEKGNTPEITVSASPVDSSTNSTAEPMDEANIKSLNPDEAAGGMGEQLLGEAPLELPPTASDTPDSAQSLPEIEKVEGLPTLNEDNEDSASCPPAPQVEASKAEETPSEELVVKADTYSKEEPSKTPVVVATGQASGSPSNAVAVDTNAPSMLSDDDDFISTPHGNDIVERSPGGRYVRFMEKLGSGASKDVYRAYDTQEGIEVAWNVVHLAGVPRNERNRIVNEVQLLERLHHHNIISFHGSWVNREKQQVNFVTEILSSGTLKSFITKVQVIRWKIAKRWAVQILKGLEYLHSQDPPVIHRDLKCENIFINGTSGDLRIGDLGLSTVHRNGKQLSVLGTPEFMAPDMYEENPYDEKVDVYSFGMCMLEIFTKEIPYRECSNPAQIYKRVSRGDPPESLRRIHSKEAREFIELCLGRLDDENGKYIRPSATELLAHPFLQKKQDDDDEVEVSPPMQERTIGEMTISPSLQSNAPKDRPSPTSSSSHRAESLTGVSSTSKQKQHSRSNSLEDDGSDRFGEMPDSEVNIRRVKVMMGRGQELDEEEGQEASNPQRDGSPESTDPNSSPGSANARAGENVSLSGSMDPKGPQESSSPSHPSMHYLVAAAVIESNSNTLPYHDDILKLVVTLPVDGQTQNVQFDFHLVEDDPIQVAKEMVAELGIPQGAVLEISETISGLARAARVNQDKYFARQQNQGPGRSSSQQLPSVTSMPAMPSNPEMQQNMVQQQMQPMNQVQNQAMVSSASHHSMPEFRNDQQQMAQMHSQQPQGMPVQDQQVPVGHQQQLGQPANIHHPQMQPQHGHVPNNDISNQNAELTSQASYGQHSQQMIPQAPPQHLNSETPGQQQHKHFAAASAEAASHSSQQPYGHSAGPPLNMQQTSNNPGQSDMSSVVSYGHSQPQHVQVASQQSAPSEAHQNQGQPPYATGQMHGQGSSVSHGMQMQHAGQQGDGGHAMQQQHNQVQSHQGSVQAQPHGQKPMQRSMSGSQQSTFATGQMHGQGSTHGLQMQSGAQQADGTHAIQQQQHAQVQSHQGNVQTQSHGHQPLSHTVSEPQQNQGSSSYGAGQMHGQSSSVGHGGTQMQPGGHQGDGAHTMQQHHTQFQAHQGNAQTQPNGQRPLQHTVSEPLQNQSHGSYGPGQMHGQASSVSHGMHMQSGGQQGDGANAMQQHHQQHAQFQSHQNNVQTQSHGRQTSQNLASESQNQGPTAYGTGQMHGQGSSVGQGMQMQPGGQQGEGAHVLQHQHAQVQPHQGTVQTQSHGHQPLQRTSSEPPQNQGPASFAAGQMHGQASSVGHGMQMPSGGHQGHQPLQNAVSESQQNQGPASFSAGQMHVQGSSVGNGMQMQAGGHQGDGAQTLQQQQQQQANVQPQPPSHQPYHPTPQYSQNQAYDYGGVTHGTSTQVEPSRPSMQPSSQHQPQMQQGQQMSQTEHFAAPANRDASFGSLQPSQPQSQSHLVAQPAEADQGFSNPQQAGTDEDIAMSLHRELNGVLGAPSMDRVNLSADEGQLDEELAAELRRLDEEFKKTVSRAKKVFDSRMDNMTRLQHEREAQHQKSLSEHERRRADFEKRLQQEEIQQNRRIEQLQEEWERKRQELRRIQQLEELEGNSPESRPSDNENMMPVSNVDGNEDLPEG
eukprot:scaffold5024_cov136-Cylindrotheca_fusiformis.AAC.24